MNKGVFLDRDGVLNEEIGSYAYSDNTFFILNGIKESIEQLKKEGYLIIVITNQAGIAKGIYTREEMHHCHDLLQAHVNYQIDHIYYSPFHENYSASLSRKPGTLLFEKAIARYQLDPTKSWMVGDSERDLIPAKELGMRTIYISNNRSEWADYYHQHLSGATEIILKQQSDYYR